MIEYALNRKFSRSNELRLLWTVDDVPMPRGWLYFEGWYVEIAELYPRSNRVYFARGRFDVSAANPPYLMPDDRSALTWHETTLPIGTTSAPLADQLVLEAMARRVPAARKLPYEQLHRSVVGLP